MKFLFGLLLFVLLNFLIIPYFTLLDSGFLFWVGVLLALGQTIVGFIVLFKMFWNTLTGMIDDEQ